MGQGIKYTFKLLKELEPKPKNEIDNIKQSISKIAKANGIEQELNPEGKVNIILYQSPIMQDWELEDIAEPIKYAIGLQEYPKSEIKIILTPLQ